MMPKDYNQIMALATRPFAKSSKRFKWYPEGREKTGHGFLEIFKVWSHRCQIPKIAIIKYIKRDIFWKTSGLAFVVERKLRMTQRKPTKCYSKFHR